MKIPPVLWLALAVMGTLVGGLQLSLWFSRAQPLNLAVAMTFLIAVPIWIIHYFRAKRLRG